MNDAGWLRAGWRTGFQMRVVAIHSLIGCARVSPSVRGSPRGPILATRLVEMKPGDFLKAVSLWDVPRFPPDVNGGIGPFEAAGLV